MLMELEILITAVLVVALLVMSVLDFALSGVSKIGLRRIAENGAGRKSALTASLAESRAEALMALHISIQILLITIAVLITGFFLRHAFGYLAALAYAAGATLGLVLLFRQLLPRAIALRNPEGLVQRMAPLLAIPYYTLRPLVGLITATLNRFHRWESDDVDEEVEEASDEEIQAFIDVGQEEGILEQDEGVMIQSVVQFGDKVAVEVMTPRTQIAAGDVGWPLDRIADTLVRTRHSRLPVYREELDNIEGYVHERDVLEAILGREESDLPSLLRPVHFVPETKPIDDLLEEMRQQGRQLALVVDEYGGISGLITMADLIEEIVGEISDDPDAAAPDVLDEAPGRYLVPGAMDLAAMEARLGVNMFPHTECTTVGGAVVELFGRLPVAGERIQHDGFSIEVVDADRRKIRTLRIRTPHPPPEA